MSDRFGAFLNDRAIEVSPPITLGVLLNSITATDSHQPATDARLAEAERAAAVLECYFFLYAGCVTARADSRLLWLNNLMRNPIF